MPPAEPSLSAEVVGDIADPVSPLAADCQAVTPLGHSSGVRELPFVSEEIVGVARIGAPDGLESRVVLGELVKGDIDPEVIPVLCRQDLLRWTLHATDAEDRLVQRCRADNPLYVAHDAGIVPFTLRGVFVEVALIQVSWLCRAVPARPATDTHLAPRLLVDLEQRLVLIKVGNLRHRHPTVSARWHRQELVGERHRAGEQPGLGDDHTGKRCS